MRTTIACRCWVDSDRFEGAIDELGLFRGGSPMPDLEGLADDVADPTTRVERGDRVLEDHLHARTKLSQVARAELGDRGAAEDHRAGVGTRHLHERPAGRGLAGTGFAHEAEGLTRQDVEAHIGDSIDLEAGAADGELDDQMLGAQERSSGVAQMSSTTAGHQDSSVDVGGRSVGWSTATPLARLRSSASRFSGLPTGNQHR